MSEGFSRIPDSPSEATAIAQLARASTRPIEIEPDSLYHVVDVNGAPTVLDLEKHRSEPWRRRGTVHLHTQDSFSHLVNEHKEHPSTHLYADVDRFALTAIFNDFGVDDVSSAGSEENVVHLGWGDHRAELVLRQTPEWKHWAGKDGQLLDQVEFAEHVEDGLDEIREPDAAYVLELAQHFHAHTSTNVRSAQRLDNGEVQLTYDQAISATAGKSGDLKIPKEIVLGIAPFEGTQPYKVVARLRYRLSGGHLSIGYKLTRPHDVLRSAFEDTVNWVADDTDLIAHRGQPPASLR